MTAVVWSLALCTALVVSPVEPVSASGQRTPRLHIDVAPAQDLPTPQPTPAPNARYRAYTIGVLEIPKLKVRQPIVYGVGLRSFDKGIGWWPGTALPGGYGNMVLGGHRTKRRKPFRHINKLRPGDQVIVTYGVKQFTYVVRGTQIVDDSDLHIIDQMPGYTITLFSCHPVGSADKRIVVYGDLVPSSDSR